MRHRSHASRTAPRRAALAAVGVLVALYGVVGFPNADELVPGTESLLGGVSEAAADTQENCITEFCAVGAGAAGVGERIAEVLLSPLGVLRLGSGDTTDLLIAPALDPIADLLVGVPFIFFVLSLREFFRSPLGPRSRPTNV